MLAVSVREQSCLKALLFLSGQRRLKSVELDGPLFCGAVGKSNARFGFLSKHFGEGVGWRGGCWEVKWIDGHQATLKRSFCHNHKCKACRVAWRRGTGGRGGGLNIQPSVQGGSFGGKGWLVGEIKKKKDVERNAECVLGFYFFFL